VCEVERAHPCVRPYDKLASRAEINGRRAAGQTSWFGGEKLRSE